MKLSRPEKFTNIYSGIQFDKFKRSADIGEKKETLGISDQETVVGMVGRLSKQKAPQYFIRAVPDVLKENPNVRFLLVGDGELRSKVAKLAEKLGVDRAVTFLGFRDDVPEVLQVLDIFVLTSLWEGLGRSLTEAMYMGCPVVATKVEGVPELVVDGKTGILVEPKDSGAIARGIIELINQPSKAKDMGKAARRRVVNGFSAEKMITQIDGLYQEMIRPKNRKSDSCRIE